MYNKRLVIRPRIIPEHESVGGISDQSHEKKKINMPFLFKFLSIPEGLAHGFLSLTEEVYLLYKCTKEYDPKFDSGIRWDDPNIGIAWPVNNPVVSEKDQRLPYLNQLDI